MKQIQVSDHFAKTFSELSLDMSVEKQMVADTLSSLTEMIHLGRDDDSICPWTDTLLRAMFTVSQYNDLLNDIVQTTDTPPERFTLSE